MLSFDIINRAESPEKIEKEKVMDLNITTIKEFLDNPKAVEVLNSIAPAILKSPMVKLVKNKTVAAVFAMVPDKKVSPEMKERIRKALEEV